MNPSNRDSEQTEIATAMVNNDGPAEAEGLNLRGTARVAHGDPRGALEDFQAATRLRPAYPEAWNNSGLVRQWLEGPAAALADFNRALALRPDYAEALNNRARSLQTLGDAAGALADFDRALGCAGGRLSAAIYHNRGTLRQGSGDLPGALSDYDRALEADPSHASTYLNRGEARKDADDLAGALADFDRAIALLPPAASASAYHGRGGVHVLRSEFAEATADYDEAIRIAPDYCVAYLSRGSACYHRRDPRGLADYLTALALDPEAASQELARVLTDGLRRGAEGVLSNCDQHLRISARDILAHARRGLTLVLLGREDQAAPHLELFLAGAPGCVPYWDRILRHTRNAARVLDASGTGVTLPPPDPTCLTPGPEHAGRPNWQDLPPKAFAMTADMVDLLFEQTALDLGR